METNKPQDLRITETQGDTIEIFLCPNKHPVAYQRKLWELVNQGMTRHEAETILLRPLQLELFYDIDTGLFAVEAEATECCEIYNPYSSRIIPNDNLPEKPEPTTPKIIDTSIGELNYVRDELQNAGYNNNPLQLMKSSKTHYHTLMMPLIPCMNSVPN